MLEKSDFNLPVMSLPYQSNLIIH